jgi:sugar lactone lactonase YvrE
LAIVETALGQSGQPVVTTIAGNGASGFTGDGGPAIDASLCGPSDMAFDSAGNMFVLDSHNLRVRRVDARTGVITTVAGGGSLAPADGVPATSVSLPWPGPNGLVVDAQGNMILSVGRYGNVLEISAADNRIRFLAQGVSCDTIGIALDAVAGNLYMADNGCGVIRRIDRSTGAVTGVIASGLNQPHDVVLDGLGNLYFSERGGARVYKQNLTSGVTTVVAGTGAEGYGGDGGPATAAQLWIPAGLALDARGNLYIGDWGNNRLRRVDAQTGIITTVAGTGSENWYTPDGPALEVSVKPLGVAIDPFGNVAIADDRVVSADDRPGVIRRLSIGQGPVTSNSAVRVWAGLKNSDDQGTQFDLRVEVYKNGAALMLAGEARCVTGITRNPSLAKQVDVLPNFAGEGGFAPGDELTLKILTRIGTNPDGTKCPGPGGSHNNATGLRLYYDSVDRPSRLSPDLAAQPPSGLFLHSSGTNLFLNTTAPAAATAKYKDSTGVNFAGGNVWREVGVWRMMLP